MFPSEEAISQKTLVGDVSVLAKSSFAFEEYLLSFVCTKELNQARQVTVHVTGSLR